MRYLLLILFFTIQTFGFGANADELQKSNVKKVLTKKKSDVEARSTLPFAFQGQMYDADIELAYNRFRYYNPDSGTYISQDPIGLHSGEPNFYAYVHDTNSYVDIFGLSCSKKTASQLSDEEFVQRIANKAEAWGIKNGYGKAGTGHVQGSKKHKYADDLLERYQRMTGQRTHLVSEQSFLNGKSVSGGTKGSARPDVLNTKTGDVYDYKFTKRQPSKLGKSQRIKNQNNVPNINNQTPIYPN